MAAYTPGTDAPTRIERLRRAQIINATIDLVAARGHAAASLSRIAAAAGVAKGTVIYHFVSRDAVLDAAYDHVLALLIEQVAAQVEDADPSRAPAVYVRAMIAHLSAHPAHARTLEQAGLAAAASGEPSRPPGRSRWEPLAQLIGEATSSSDPAPGPSDIRTAAILAGGMIDAVVREFLEDPAYDTAAAARAIIAVMGWDDPEDDR
ncbi:TetR/AcrR family transcriptional regulator [Dietzia lutea]|uniref:HTH tetR-type domain-containing protein n=1 Tax=Dietzia lutea TaxID=546160 RepID=A0A2S1R862_9ACTN|nr:TetR/AcrR family transcriptional regulator [Dietzia lutea]AWH92487.1 hypothetical protein A6035_10285 [Dietzia lutea]